MNPDLRCSIFLQALAQLSVPQHTIEQRTEEGN
jgi:hypothetical protein